MKQNEVLKNAMTDLEVLKIALLGIQSLFNSFEEDNGSVKIPPIPASNISFNLSHIRSSVEKLNLYLHSELVFPDPEILPQPVEKFPAY